MSDRHSLSTFPDVSPGSTEVSPLFVIPDVCVSTHHVMQTFLCANLLNWSSVVILKFCVCNVLKCRS